MRELFSALTRASVALVLTLLLLPDAAQALTVIFDDPSEPRKATGIVDLDVPGFGTFNVAFDQAAFANQIYGEFPGDRTPLPPFFTLTETKLAADAVNAALNAADALSIGEVGLEGTDGFNIGWRSFILDPPLPNL